MSKKNKLRNAKSNKLRRTKTIKKKVVNEQIVDFDRVHDFLDKLLGRNVHAKRVLSISNAVLGVITSASLAISLIGQGYASAKGKVTKHAIKQVDRLLGNDKFAVWAYFEYWIEQTMGARTSVIIALEWTEFDKDNQSTLALYLTTSHGRSTPLLWKTYKKSTIKGKRVKYEKKILQRLKKLSPENIVITILADRGFGYVEFYTELERLGFHYVVRFKGNINVFNSKGEVKTAKEWVSKDGRAKRLENAKVTLSKEKKVAVVVCTQDKKMKEPWCLASDNPELKTAEIVNYYSKRWGIEPTFRDQKDIRFGMGMYNISVSKPIKRDRLFFLAAISCVLLTILGAAGEAIGMDRTLKANTVKRRTHSLFRQGVMLYELIPEMAEDRLLDLINKFHELLMENKLTKSILFIV